jgi:hypothetical protein
VLDETIIVLSSVIVTDNGDFTSQMVETSPVTKTASTESKKHKETQFTYLLEVKLSSICYYHYHKPTEIVPVNQKIFHVGT